MRRFVAILGALALVGVLAMPVFAHNPRWAKGHHMMSHWGGGPGCCRHRGDYRNLTEEQRSQLNMLYKKFHDETAQLRSDIHATSAELMTLLNSANPDAEKAKALQKNISDLKAELDQKRLSFRIEVRQIAPDAKFGKRYSRAHGPRGPGKRWN
jgi:Spy/CpxP family protein refolding chaperone